MRDPFRIIPVRHLGHGFSIAEALDSNVPPACLDLFTTVATGYIILHAIHRGLSAGGGPLLFTTFFDTLIFDGIASAIVPSFLTFHVRAIMVIWFQEKFHRSPISVSPSSPSSTPASVERSSSNKQIASSSEPPLHVSHPSRSSAVSIFPYRETLFSCLFPTVALKDKETENQSVADSPLSPSREAPPVRARSEPDLSPGPDQHLPGVESPEPYPLIVHLFSRFCERSPSSPQQSSASHTPRATLSSQGSFYRRQSSERRFCFFFQRRQASLESNPLESPGPSNEGPLGPPSPQTADTRASLERTSEPQLSTSSRLCCLHRDDESPELSRPSSSPTLGFPASPGLCRVCPLGLPIVLESPLLHTSQEHVGFSSSTSSPPPLCPPSSSITMEFCGEIKAPAVVSNWAPVAVSLLTLAFTWRHIDRLVDELMNQTLRTVY